MSFCIYWGVIFIQPNTNFSWSQAIASNPLSDTVPPPYRVSPPATLQSEREATLAYSSANLCVLLPSQHLQGTNI